LTTETRVSIFHGMAIAIVLG